MGIKIYENYKVKKKKFMFICKSIFEHLYSFLNKQIAQLFNVTYIVSLRHH